MPYLLDHVAIAAPDTTELLHLLTGPGAGTIISGGETIGFRVIQVWVGDETGDGMTIELIEPWSTEVDDFLLRFVTRHGAGPHHMTFKVPDLAALIDRAREAGYEPVKISLSDPEWMEAFLMPREAHGTVVQLAQSSHSWAERAAQLAHIAADGPRENPRWWGETPTPAGPPVRLRRVVLSTPSLPSALGFFGGLLLGDEVDSGERWSELVWPNGSRLRLEERNDRAPGLDRLEIEGLHDEAVVLGTRLVPA